MSLLIEEILKSLNNVQKIKLHENIKKLKCKTNDILIHKLDLCKVGIVCGNFKDRQELIEYSLIMLLPLYAILSDKKDILNFINNEYKNKYEFLNN